MKFNYIDISAIIHKAEEEKNTFVRVRTVKTQAAQFT
jgi:RNA binding exosome subunit